MTDFSPREIVSELDRFIVGQADAKRAEASREAGEIRVEASSPGLQTAAVTITCQPARSENPIRK